VVDSHALAEALDQGKLFAAGVDVVDGEPNVKADHPLVKQPRCVVLPHVGSATWDSREGMALLCESSRDFQPDRDRNVSLIVRAN
jgi:glyoxylate/hydroxypyruvate reductase